MPRPSNYLSRDLIAGFINDTDPYPGNSSSIVWRQMLCHDWNLLAVVSGYIKVFSETGSVDLPVGSLTLIRPGRYWSFESRPFIRAYWFHFQPETAVEWSEPLPGICQIAGQPQFFERSLVDLEEIWQISQLPQMGWHSMASGLLNTVIIRGNMLEKRRKVDPRLLPAALRLLDFDAPAPDVKELAASCGMSRTRFYREFHSCFGVTPRVYREQEEMRRVCQLLKNTDDTLGEICAKISREDIFYLSRRFKELFGSSPSEFRKHHRSTGVE